MKAPKIQDRLDVGWRTGSAGDFLGLSEDEKRLVAMRISLVDAIRETRKRSGLTQVALAKKMQSSQSRIAKIEAGDPTASLELIVRALIAAGASNREVGLAISGEARKRK